MAKPEKKALKEHINENGFFLHINDIEQIAREEVEKLDDAIRTRAKLPKGESVQVFRGLASQNFKKGDKSRNGYKYDHSGWDLKSYKGNPIIFYGHDMDMPLGQMLSIEITENGMEVVYFVDYQTKTGAEYEHEIRNGYVRMLSTGAITQEKMVEDNKTGERMTFEEAREKGIDLWAVLFGESDEFTLVVTKAELIEVSVVGVGSNPKAFTASDSLKSYFQNTMTKELKDLEKDEARPEEIKEGEEVDTSSGDKEPEESKEEDSTETPPSEPESESGEDPEPAENAEGEADPVETPSEPEAPAEETDNMSQCVKDLFGAMANTIAAQDKRIAELQNRIESVPNDKSLRLTNQLAKPEEKGGKGLTNMLKAHGIIG